MFEKIKELFENGYRAKYEENEKGFDLLYGLAKGTNEELNERARKLETEIEQKRNRHMLMEIEDGHGYARVGNELVPVIVTRIDLAENHCFEIECTGTYSSKPGGLEE